ncbi:hypothetical protein [Nocardioides sp. SYSU D00038]|uniref:hypothetical protein n=1 Tax=Nocardioides sp. SYSU D00038 TaxID=2812554 RepID=UPI001967A6F4|nr:hypothetical protein [Nocardioides sp. SYSU D00038]
MTSARRWGAHLVAALLTLPLLAGCGDQGGDDRTVDGPGASEPPVSRAASPQTDLCSLLTPEEVRALAGKPLPLAREKAGDGGTRVCVWGRPTKVGLQLGAVPASEWAEGLPEAVAALEESGAHAGDPDLAWLRRGASAVSAGRALKGDRACRLFERLLALNGVAGARDWYVSAAPAAAPQLLSGQACRDGWFATLQLVRPGLTGSTAETARMGAAFEALLGRAALSRTAR